MSTGARLRSSARFRVAEFKRKSPPAPGFARSRTIAAAEGLSGRGRGMCRRVGFIVERGRDVANADDADQAVFVDNRQMADVVLVHQVTNVFERIGRTAGTQLLHRDQL